MTYIAFVITFYFFLPGKRITQKHKQQLSIAKQHAESIAVITKELGKEFLEV
jgi:hypothetical protein